MLDDKIRYKQDALDHVRQTFPFQFLFCLSENPVADIHHNRFPDFGLVRKVEIKGSFGNTGRFCNIVDACLIHPFFREQFVCRLYHPDSFFFLL